jgi:enterochelin esterase-like enzyme
VKRIFLSIVAMSVIIFACTAQLSAQIPSATEMPKPYYAGGGPPPFKSPEVSPDRKITFRIKAPTASDVKLLIGERNFDRAYPMAKGEKGIWSTTIGPVNPEIYRYHFVIDGAEVNVGNVEVPGPSPAFYDRQRVPHGTLTRHIYLSGVQNIEKELEVYVPPQYYTEPSRRFPVLYHWGLGQLSGFSSDILDNQIAEKKAVPMIVVLLDRSVAANVPANTPAAHVPLSKEFAADNLPFVDKAYRTLPGRNNRAMAGASQMGATAFDVTMANLDKIGSLGIFGSGIFGGLLNRPDFVIYPPYDPDKQYPGMLKALVSPATKLNLFYMSVGMIDPRRPYNEKAAEDFRKRGIPVVFKTFKGGHEDGTWRYSIADLTTMLFR